MILSSPGRATSWQELFARFDSHDIPPEEVDEFAQIMDEVVTERRMHLDPANTRKAFWEESFAKLDAGKTEDEDFDAYMTERPMNRPAGT